MWLGDKETEDVARSWEMDENGKHVKWRCTVYNKCTAQCRTVTSDHRITHTSDDRDGFTNVIVTARTWVGNKLDCLVMVTAAHACEQLAQSGTAAGLDPAIL